MAIMRLGTAKVQFCVYARTAPRKVYIQQKNTNLKSADGVPFPLLGLSARIVSLATWVEAMDLRGQVPYQLLFCFN